MSQSVRKANKQCAFETPGLSFVAGVTLPMGYLPTPV